MNATELEGRVETLDMSLISAEYNKQVANTMLNLITGKIPQAVLIQVQFLKLELLETMKAVDDLYGANQINLQLLASIPAIIAAFFVLKITLRVLFATLTRRIATEQFIHTKMRDHLRQIERDLILRSRVDGEISMLGHGKLAFESWRLARTLETYWAYFQPAIRTSLRTDFADLMSAGFGGLTYTNPSICGVGGNSASPVQASASPSSPQPEQPSGGSNQPAVRNLNAKNVAKPRKIPVHVRPQLVTASSWHRLRVCDRIRSNYRFLGKESFESVSNAKLSSVDYT